MIGQGAQEHNPRSVLALDRTFDNFNTYWPETETLKKLIDAERAHDLDNVGKYIYNIFEHTGKFEPEIKQIMKTHNASGVLMSGSGSSVFGLFRFAADAEAAKDELVKRGYRTYVCIPVDNMEE